MAKTVKDTKSIRIWGKNTEWEWIVKKSSWWCHTLATATTATTSYPNHLTSKHFWYLTLLNAVPCLIFGRLLLSLILYSICSLSLPFYGHHLALGFHYKYYFPSFLDSSFPFTKRLHHKFSFQFLNLLYIYTHTHKILSFPY